MQRSDYHNADGVRLAFGNSLGRHSFRIMITDTKFRLRLFDGLLARVFIIAVSLAGCLELASVKGESVIAFWDFNDGFDEPNETVRIQHLASIGSGTLYQQRADTDGNGKGGLAYANASLSINASDGRAMAWNDISKSGDNDAEFFVEFSTVGFTGIQVRFDVLGDGDVNSEIVSYDLKYDVNPLVEVTNPGDVVGTVYDFAGGLSTTVFNNQPISPNGDTFITETIDLSGIAEVNDQSVVILRIDDLDGNDSLRFDNFLVTGVTAIPEPSTAVALALAFAFVVGRRRRASFHLPRTFA